LKPQIGFGTVVEVVNVVEVVGAIVVEGEEEAVVETLNTFVVVVAAPIEKLRMGYHPSLPPKSLPIE